jgi:hypothetical protein
MNIQSKINKLITALKVKGYTYLLSRDQYYSNKLEKVCTIHKINRLMPIEEYNRLYPDNKKDPSKYKFVKVEVFSSHSNIEILKKLVELYKDI